MWTDAQIVRALNVDWKKLVPICLDTIISPLKIFAKVEAGQLITSHLKKPLGV